MMRRKLFIVLMLGIYFGVSAFATDVETYNQTETAACARVSAEIDKKIVKGFHVYAGEELRLNENMSAVDRLHGNVGMSYKMTDWLKVAVDYNPIIVFKSDEADQWRHRFSFDLTGSYKWSQFKFSLRERVQITRKMADKNPYQEPKWKAALRSRFKVSYDFHTRWEPFASVELRHYLNSPLWTVDAAGTASYYGYKDAYLDRIRVMAGVEYAISKAHRLEMYLMYDNTYTKDYDSKKTPVLKSATLSKGHYITLGIAYSFRL